VSEPELPLDEHLKPAEVSPRLMELGAILEGHFRLSSGRHSDRYFQCALVLQYPGLAKELGRLLAEQFNELEIDFVLSPAVGGMIIGHEVGRGLGRRHIFAERRDGKFELRRGFEILKGENALIVDDVLTRGTSFQELMKLIQEREAHVAGLGVIVDRREQDVRIEAHLASLVQMEVRTWDGDQCPLCKSGQPLDSPGSRHAG
jgi:orotate phosphoribosyltransferase